MILIITISIIALIIYLIVIKTIDKKDLKDKIVKVLYQSSKAIIIFLISLQIYSKFNVLDFFPLIPEKDIGINIAVYTFFLSIIISLVEIIVSSKLATIDIVLSSKNSIDHVVTDNIKVTGEKFVSAYMFITVEGDFQKLNNTKIKIQFPKIVEAQSDNLITDESNTLTFRISDYITSEGRAIIPIDLLKQPSRVNNESFIKPVLIREKKTYKNLFIKVTANKLGIISE